MINARTAAMEGARAISVMACCSRAMPRAVFSRKRVRRFENFSMDSALSLRGFLWKADRKPIGRSQFWREEGWRGANLCDVKPTRGRVKERLTGDAFSPADTRWWPPA